MRICLTLLALTGCIGGEAQESGESPNTNDTHEGSGGPCGEAGICSLGTRDATVNCGDSTGGLAATSNAVGELSVVHEAAQQGCCPTFLLSAEASQRRSEISVSYDLSQDDCDCVCELDLSYTLTGIPSGAWTLRTPDGQQLAVNVQ